MRCQKCGCNEFYYTEGIKPKKIKWKFILLITLIGTFGAWCKTNESIIGNILLGAIVAQTLTFIGILIYEKISRSRTHTKAICAYCRNIEWID